jgi:uncharacterized membrane protein YuzA (DUF378 family)
MRSLNWLTLILLVIGGINWGLVGVANIDLVADIFGNAARLIYAIVGLAALYQIVVLIVEPASEPERLTSDSNQRR